MVRDCPGLGKYFHTYHDRSEFLKLTGYIYILGGYLHFVLPSIIYISVHEVANTHNKNTVTVIENSIFYNTFHAFINYIGIM